ncbi:hypothetical protein [Mitsuaria sp. 7]|uniref:hypothetical protein n=1 Tax=Mitsuaria sp. 7 TaxID=1658665 RepID=UPI0012FB6E32|nr:hypothetical protein [Mitsuaria sp. 7]
MTELLLLLLSLVTDTIGYFTAWLLLPVLTLGRLRVEPLMGGAFPVRGRGRIKKQPDGHWLVEAQLAPALGLLLWGCIGVAVCLVKI